MKRRSRRRRKRRRRRPWLFMVATWSKSRSYRRNGQIGREGENERAGVKRMGHPVRGSVAWTTFAGETCKLSQFKIRPFLLDSLPNEDPRKGMRKVNSRPLDEPGRERREGRKRRGKENFF